MHPYTYDLNLLRTFGAKIMEYIQFIRWGCIGVIFFAIISAVLFPLNVVREDFCIIVRVAYFALAAALVLLFMLFMGIKDEQLFDVSVFFYRPLAIMAFFVLFLMLFIVFLTFKYAWLNWRKK